MLSAPLPARFACFAAVPLVLLFATAAPAQELSDLASGTRAEVHLISSNANVNVNALLGANRFYDAGFNGSRAIAASIDAGHVWNGHETLTQVTTFLDASQTGGGTAKNASVAGLGAYDFHGTWVGHTLAGRDNPGGSNNSGLASVYKPGIAPGATLWSGATATRWNSALNFEISATTFVNPYYRALITGVGGRTADVVNSSFGYEDAGGTSFLTGAIDGMARTARRTVVFSAGNSGAGVNRIGGAASGYNTLSVGSVGNDTGNPAYSGVSGFSSRGPQDYQRPLAIAFASEVEAPSPPTNTNPVVSGARARVDILAPGENLGLARYGGATGGRAGGTNDLSSGNYDGNVAGTSFSAPTVAGAIALMADAARANYTGELLENALDGQVVKAVLLNSADKLSGWNNGQTFSSGVVQTSQALDFNQGAGRLNLNAAYDQYVTGTQDVAGLGGGVIGARGWDFGVAQQGLFNDYTFAEPLLAGSSFTATLNWFVNTTYNGTEIALTTTSVSWNSFTNLYLEMYRLDAGLTTLVARSDAGYLNTEHFSFAVTSTGLYSLRVGWGGELYDNAGASQQTYGLAWRGTSAAAVAPEVGSFWFALVGIGAVAVRRRTRAAGR